MLDVDKIKNDFSMFKNQEENFIYLDSAATSLTPDIVVDEMSDYYKHYRGTVHRTLYKSGAKADEKYQNARLKIAEYINAKNNEIIFMKSTTSALNALARSIIETLNLNDEIISSELEHHSNILPWREYAKKKGVKLNYVNLIDNKIVVEEIKKQITEKTKVITLNHVSNVIGDITPIKEIAKLCNEKSILFIVDGAQAITHEKVDVKDLGCDFYVFSAHKLFGPTGLGILYGKENLLKDFIFEYGGDMAHIVELDLLQTKELPILLEAGTPSIAEVIGFGKSIDYINQIGIDKINKHVIEIQQYAMEKMKKINQIEIYNIDVIGSLITFNIKDASAHDALSSFAHLGICMRGGHMCNQLTLKKLNQNAVLRVSFSIYNDKNDIDLFMIALEKVIKDPMLWWEI